MKKVIALLLWTYFLQGCEKKKEIVMENPNQDSMELKGIISDGYLKRFPYSIRQGEIEWALDVIQVPKSTIGKEVVIKAHPMNIDGIQVLTKVVLNGERLMTKKEWADSNTEGDPFAEDEKF